ncbi:MAG: glycosyltransferase, partial [Lachnospiraceae bacterium]|nr:glycosyltransferase [Lachnospiraceae bacterium]
MITVLLAAWNGEAYIEEQLDSILGQDGLELDDLRIVISDDGSTDRTREILERYHEQFPEQIILKHRTPERKEKDLADGIPAAAGNFFWLLSQAGDADYVMLSDQDDVWKPNKVEVLMNEM